MAILCEALSVITRVSTIQEKFPGGLKKFVKQIPNATYCSDGELVRVGFMSPLDVGVWIDFLNSNGLQVFEDETEATFRDSAVVDQFQGLTALCSWVETGMEGNLRWAKLTNSTIERIELPRGRKLQDVIKGGEFDFVANEDISSDEIIASSKEITPGTFEFTDQTSGEKRYVSTPFISRMTEVERNEHLLLAAIRDQIERSRKWGVRFAAFGMALVAFTVLKDVTSILRIIGITATCIGFIRIAISTILAKRIGES